MTHDTVDAEVGYGEKVSQRLCSKKVEEGRAHRMGFALVHNGPQNAATVEAEKVA